jgi:hypothetical protein
MEEPGIDPGSLKAKTNPKLILKIQFLPHCKNTTFSL